MRCDDCEFEARSKGGLATHRRAKHPRSASPTTNSQALDRTLGILADLGRIEPIDAARVMALRSMAFALDCDASNAQLWRQYREALTDLLRVDEDADSDLAAALAEIRGAAQVGDTPAP